jgi:predicted Zn-dependent peptidase
MYYDHPMSYVEILWNRLLYGDQPAGWYVAGTKESVKKIDRQKLLNYMESQYVAPNTIISVAGKINNSKVIEKVKQYFSKIKTTQPFKKSKVLEKQREPNLLLHQRKTDQTHLYLGIRGYNIFHPQRYAQDLLGVILGEMMSSRLFIEVRVKQGIAYYIKTSVDSNPDTGCLVTQTGVDNKNVDKAILTILKEYKKISQKKVPKEELKKAKDNLKGKTALLLESSDAQASFYAGQELLEKKILTPEEVFKKIDKVSQSDILKVAKDIFQPQKLNLALIGPFNDKNRFEKLLKL